MTSRTELLWAYHRKKLTGSTDTATLREQLLKENKKLAISIARRMTATCNESLDDLTQMATIGLDKAIERFDPNKGVAFSSFAVPYIRGEILHFLRDHWHGAKIPRRQVELHGKVRRIQRRFVAAGRPIACQQIAAALGIEAKRWREIEEAMSRKPLVSIDEMHHLSAEPDEEDERSELRAEMYRRLALLPNPYRDCIVELYFGQRSEETIAQQQGTTPDQVHAWIEQGLECLRSGHCKPMEVS